MLLFPARMDLGVMTTEGYATLSRAPELDFDYQIQFRVIPRRPVLKKLLPFNRG